jgi:prevent-host-death family protein
MDASAKHTEESVSSEEAGRNFSKLLSGVQAGRSYIVTAHGNPIARLTPCEQTDADSAARAAAKEALLARLRSQPAMNLGITWTRDELYER